MNNFSKFPHLLLPSILRWHSLFNDMTIILQLNFDPCWSSGLAQTRHLGNTEHDNKS